MDPELHSLRVPRDAPSDEIVHIVEWLVGPGDFVDQATAVVVVEGEKSVYEVFPEIAGYVYPIFEPGSEVGVGEPLAIVSNAALDEKSRASLRSHDSSMTENEEQRETEETSSTSQPADIPVSSLPDGVGYLGPSLTHGASAAAEELGLTVEEITRLTADRAPGDVVTRVDVLDRAGQWMRTSLAGDSFGTLQGRDVRRLQGRLDRQHRSAGTAQRVVLIGAGQGCTQVLDVILSQGMLEPVGYMNDGGPSQVDLVELPYLGEVSVNTLGELYRRRMIDGVVNTVGSSPKFRYEFGRRAASAGLPMPNVLHPSAHVGAGVIMGVGNIVLAHCHFGAMSALGSFNFLSAGTNLEHHGVICDAVKTGPSVAFSGSVTVGSRASFGTGVVVEPRVRIGSDAVIASGLAITRDVSEGQVVKGRTIAIYS